MELGIFARTYARPTLEAALDAARADGLAWVQLNLAGAGLPTVPEAVPPDLGPRVRDAVSARGLRVAGLSGTVNLIHPDPAQRAENVRRLAGLIAAAPSLGAAAVSLCTGSRDPANMWRHHPGNALPDAWADLLAALAVLVPTAEAAGVTLGVEPEPGNVVASAPLARRLLDEVRSPSLKIIFDAANLLTGHPAERHRTVLDEAAALLGPDVITAHAKQLDAQGREVPTPDPAGSVDFDDYLAVLHGLRFTGPLVLHGLPEASVRSSVAWLREKAENLPRRLDDTRHTKDASP